MIAVFAALGSFALMPDTSNSENPQKPVDLGDKFFYSESDGRYIEHGQFWHPADSPNNHSVRWLGHYRGPVYDRNKVDQSNEGLIVKDIYMDINQVKEPQTLSVDFSMYNHENRELYFTLEDNGTSPSVCNAVLNPSGSNDVKEMGSVAGDGGTDTSWTYEVMLDNFSGLSAAESTITIDLRCSSWEDSGYSTLYTRDNLDVKIHLIDRTHGDWDVILEENYDDGNVPNGWSTIIHAQQNANGTVATSIETREEVYRSDRYSLGIGAKGPTYDEVLAGATKEFSVASEYSEAYAVFAFRLGRDDDWDEEPEYHGLSPVGIGENARKEDTENVVGIYNFERYEWCKTVIPLPTGTTQFIKLNNIISANSSVWAYTYIDDFYIIAK